MGLLWAGVELSEAAQGLAGRRLRGFPKQTVKWRWWFRKFSRGQKFQIMVAQRAEEVVEASVLAPSD